MDDLGRISRRALIAGAAGAAVVLGGGGVLADHEIDVHPSLKRFFGGCGNTPTIPHDTQHQIYTDTLASKAMGREVPYTLSIPLEVANGPVIGPRTALVLALPGEGGTATSLTEHIGVQAFATSIGFYACFVSPGDVHSSYYHPRNDGTDMSAFLLAELLPHVEKSFHVGGSRGARALYGYSMGGYGALLLAQERPEMFCAAAAASPAVFPTYRDAITGHPGTFDSAADWQRYGVWNHLAAMGPVPVRIDCGDADPFASTARQLLAKIPNAVGEISSGCHDVGFWRRHAADDLAFLKSHLRA